MKNWQNKILVVATFIFYFSNLYSFKNEVKCQKITEKITLLGEKNGYIKKVIFKGRFNNESEKYIPIVSNELEKQEISHDLIIIQERL